MRALLLAGLLLSARAALAAPAAPPPDARAHKEQGDQRRKAGDAEGALEAYRAALKRHGGYAEAYEAIGEVQYAQRRYPEAIEAFGYAVEIDPAYALAWYNLAFAARKSGDLARARGAYEQYTRLRPADPDGHFGLAETLRLLGEREPAAAEYQLFIDLAKATPSQAAWVERARAALAELRPAPAARPGPGAGPGGAGGAALAVGGAAAGLAGGAGAAAGAPPAVAPAAKAVAEPAAGPGTTAAAAEGAVPAPAPAAIAPTAPAGGATAGPGAAPAAASPAAPAPGAGPAGGAAATPALGPGAAHAAPVVPPPPAAPGPRHVEPAPTAALVEKLGAGDRAYLAGDYRTALFAYQDAAYLEASALAPRLRLAKAYAALRYPEKAEAQLRQVLALDPENAEARQQLEALRSPATRAGPPPPAGGAAAAPVAPAAGAGGGRVYRFTPEEAPPPGTSPAPGPRADAALPPPPAPVVAPEAGPSAADLYRLGVAQVGRREFALAVDSFNRALERNPGLMVAFEARASARFGLGQYREAAQDYQTANDASPERASPVWGLAECWRLLGDRRAAQAYQRYAEHPGKDVVEAQREVARRRVRELSER